MQLRRLVALKREGVTSRGVLEAHRTRSLVLLRCACNCDLIRQGQLLQWWGVSSSSLFSSILAGQLLRDERFLTNSSFFCFFLQCMCIVSIYRVWLHSGHSVSCDQSVLFSSRLRHQFAHPEQWHCVTSQVWTDTDGPTFFAGGVTLFCSASG